jgi:hypothetical protein
LAVLSYQEVVDSSALAEPERVSRAEQVWPPEPVLQRVRVSQPEGEQRAWPLVSRLVWELDDSLQVAALPVSPVADERQAVWVVDAQQARVLREPALALALAQVQPVERERQRRVQERELEPVVDD